MFGHAIASRTSSGPRLAPACSRPGALGTQLGICTKTLTGRPIASSCISLTPGKSEDIGDLVRVDEHRRRAVRDDGAREFRDGHHAALDMHVPVAEARHEIASLGLDDARLLADRRGSRPARHRRSVRRRSRRQYFRDISPEWTLTQRPLRMTRSAALRPMATSTRRAPASAQVFSTCASVSVPAVRGRGPAYRSRC